MESPGLVFLPPDPRVPGDPFLLEDRLDGGVRLRIMGDCPGGVRARVRPIGGATALLLSTGEAELRL